jgi:protein-S-isoprenylcysteine O-methyltransferase Ste14
MAGAESPGAVGIILGAVGGAPMLVAGVSVVPQAVGVAGLCLFFIGLLLSVVQSWKLARTGDMGFARALYRCVRRALSFVFWMLP